MINKNKLLDYINVLCLAVFVFYTLYELILNLSSFQPLQIAGNKLSILMNTNYIATIFLSLIILCKKQFKLWYFTAIWALSFILSKTAFFDTTLHTILIKYHLHPWLLFTPSNLINAQTDKVFISSVLFVVSFIFILFKKNRSFDRAIVFFILSSIIFTTFFFHRIVAHQLIIKDYNVVSALMGKVINTDDYDMLNQTYEIKTFKFTIHSKSIPQDIEQLEPLSYSNFPPNAFKVAQQMTQFYLNNHPPLLSQLFLEDQLGLGNFILISKLKNDTVFYYVIKHPYNEMEKRDEIWFFMLCLMAHTTWYFGGIFLWYWHNKRFKKARKSELG